MSLYIGVDFHPHQQTACWVDSNTGELKINTFHHQNRDELVRFYQTMPPSLVKRVGYFVKENGIRRKFAEIGELLLFCLDFLLFFIDGQN